jgi:hypothetical protein
MDPSDAEEDLDLALRHATRPFPEQLARALLPPGTEITSAVWAETQVTARQRRLDRALAVVAGGVLRFEHVEMQLEMVADVPFRIYEYHVLSALALAGETPPGKEVPRIQSTVVLLSGREKAWPEEGEYQTSPDGATFSGVRFRIDAVYQRTVAELLARASPLWMIFAPLAVDADPERMKEVVERLRAQTSRREMNELAAALAVVAGKDKRRRGLKEGIVALIKEELMESSVFKMGEQRGELRGRQEGEQKSTALLYGKRLGRPLTDDERRTLFARLQTLGLDRIQDVALERSPEALAAWLAEPDAR